MRRAQDIIRDWSGQVRLGQGGQGQLQKHHRKHVLTAINLFLYAQVCFQQKWRQLNTCTKSTYHKCTQTECATWNIHDTGNTDTERQVSASNEQVEFSSPPRCQEKHDTSRSMGRELSGTSAKSVGWVKCSSELEGNYSLFLSLKFLTHEHPSKFKYHTWEESVKLEATSNLFFWGLLQMWKEKDIEHVRKLPVRAAASLHWSPRLAHDKLRNGSRHCSPTPGFLSVMVIENRCRYPNKGQKCWTWH